MHQTTQKLPSCPENVSIRLKRIMQERNLSQRDILKLAEPYCEKYQIKMNKSDLSQFVNGKVEPSPQKIVILSFALNVFYEWLCGFDVPMDENEYRTEIEFVSLLHKLSSDEKKALHTHMLTLLQDR